MILAGVDKWFPMHLWDHLLLQTEKALNMLQATNLKPWVSAHTYMNGQHDYNRMPLAPLGCHTMAHNKPEMRTSWGPWTSEKFYMDTSTEHYRCFKILMKDTRIFISGTVNFHHQFITAPNEMPEEKSHCHSQKPCNGTTNTKTCPSQWNRQTSTEMSQQYIHEHGYFQT